VEESTTYIRASTSTSYSPRTSFFDILARQGYQIIQGLEAMSAEMVAVAWSRYRQPAPCFLISNRFQSTRIGGRASANEWDIRERVDRCSDRRSGYVPFPSFLLRHFCAVQVRPAVSQPPLGWRQRASSRSRGLRKQGSRHTRASPRAINAVRCTQPDRLSWRLSRISAADNHWGGGCCTPVAAA
jgi:hypothetical protein